MLRASDVSPRMFDSDFMDFFSRTHWLMVPTLFVPLSLGVAAYAVLGLGVAPLAVAVDFALGWLIWSLTEYWLHRTAFHWEPQTWWGPKFHFIVHGVHHKWHQDPYRLVMPPAVSLTLAVLFYGLFQAAGLLGALAFGASASWATGAYAGFVMGYVVYDCTHYILHHWKPRGAWMTELRKHHLAHHHSAPERKFGVSSMVWDRVFGTL